jgi:hypothetical protein
MITMAILAVLTLIAAVMALLTCDDLVRLLASSESALTNLEVLLKMRHDLVPNLLEAMRDHVYE